MSLPAIGELHRRYLRVLGLEPTWPDLESLDAIVAAHVRRVPFENVSKLLLYASEGAGRPLTLTEFLDGIEDRDLGGTCYSSNPFLCGLLQALGYRATLLAADMETPDVHTSIRVLLQGRAYHVDVGYGAPFTHAMALDGLPHVITNGGDRYVLNASDRADTYEMSMHVRGQRRHGYIVHPPPRAPEFFTRTILESYEPGRTFMRCLRISRCFRNRVVDLRNRTLTISQDGSSTETILRSTGDLRRALDTVLQMPRCPVDEAVGILEQLTGKPFFGTEPWQDSLD
jgi:arylamine N-acetyltransferase